MTTAAAIKPQHASFSATVSAKKLLSAIKVVLGTARPSPSELLTRVLVEQTARNITLSSTDLLNTTRVMLLRTSMRGVGSAHIHPAGLFAFVQSAARSSDEVELAFDSGALTVKAGGRKLCKFSGYGEEYPTLPTAPNAEPLSIERRALLALLTDAVRFASKDEHRTHLNGVLLHRVDGALLAVATDGTRLVKLSHAMPGASGALRALIPRKSVMLWINALKSAVSDDVELRVASGSAQLSAAPFTLFARPAEATFPPYEHVIATSWDRELELPREPVDSMARIALAMRTNRRAVPCLTLSSDGHGALRIASSNTDDATVEESIPYSGAGFKVSVSARIMLDALSLGREPQLTLRVSGDLDPMQLVSERATAVLMPMRV
jgi:DNA polymerase-3 subunit beta